MATPPTLAAEYESAWNTSTTPKTASVTVNTGDVLVVAALSETNNATSTPTGGGLTYNLAQNILVSQYTSVYVWTAVAASSQTFTLSVANTGGQQWGFNCLRFSGSDGVGASSKTNVASGAPSLALTTGGDNSAIVAFNGDWNAGGGARTWRTINSVTPTSGNGLEVTYQATGNYTIYGAYWSDAGAAGSKTTGLTAPTGQKYAIIAVEVLGSSGGSTPVDVADAGSAAEAATVTATTALADTSSAADATAVAAAVAVSDTSSAADAATATAVVSLADSGSSAEAAAVTAAAPVSDAGSAAEAVSAAVTLPVADSASGADSLLVNTGGGTPKPLADAGSAADTLAAAAAVPLGDVAGAAEALTVAAALALADAASAADVLAGAPTGPLADGGTAGDALAIGGITVPLADTASTAEALAVAVSLALADIGTAADTGTGQDASFVPKALPDAGAAVERLRVLIVRPNTGTVARPNTGIIVRPNTGTIARP